MTGAIECALCGGAVVQLGRGRPRKFCSDACTRRAGKIAEMRRRRGELPELDVVRAGRPARRRVPRIAGEFWRPCGQCGCLVVGLRVQNVRCHACRSAARRARGAEYRRTAGYLSKAMVRNWVRRGAVLAGDVSASDIAQLRYFAVDCPDCGCGMSDDSHRRTSKTIDHVIPIARGGEHSLENIRVVCWSCNSRKRDRVLA